MPARQQRSWLFAKKRARASDYSDCSGRFPLSCAAGSARRYASVESSLGPDAAFPGTQSKYPSGQTISGEAARNNRAGDLGGRQSARLISCKVIDVRVATSSTPRCVNSTIFSAISWSRHRPPSSGSARRRPSRVRATFRGSFRLEGLTGKEWTDRHSCRVPFKCGEINATGSR
jgi:hypothetical protein